MDYSAVCDLVGLGRRAAARGCQLVLTELRDEVRVALTRARVHLPELQSESSQTCPAGLLLVANYNPALKHCEDSLLASFATLTPTAVSVDISNAGVLKEMLSETFGDWLDKDAEDLADLADHFEYVEYQSGATLWRAGEAATFCAGVIGGHLHSLQPWSSRNVHDSRMMEVVQRGAFVGFAGLLNQVPYVHTVVVPADEAVCTCAVLSLANFTTLTERKPRVANAVLRAFLRRQAYEWRALSRLAAQV